MGETTYYKNLVKKVKQDNLYNVMKYGSLYTFFFIWCFINNIILATAYNIFRIKLRGFRDKKDKQIF